MAKTDGSLQIQIPDPQNPGNNINWNRQYYAVPLEVRPHANLHVLPLSLSLFMPSRVLFSLLFSGPE